LRRKLDKGDVVSTLHLPREDRPLTNQIVMGVKRQIDDRQLRPVVNSPPAASKAASSISAGLLVSDACAALSPRGSRVRAVRGGWRARGRCLTVPTRALHPDSNSPEKRAAAFALVKSKEHLLRGPMDDGKPKPPPLPSLSELIDRLTPKRTKVHANA
jgi:hypothetical protein